MTGLIFNIQKGEILSIINASTEGHIAAQVTNIEDDYILAEGDYLTEYVLNKTIIDRPVLALGQDFAEIQANGTEICTITGIPVGAEVISNGTTITADGNPIEFVTDIPGGHKLQISLWPYQDAEVTINAI